MAWLKVNNKRVGPLVVGVGHPFKIKTESYEE